MGSEMCIRDSFVTAQSRDLRDREEAFQGRVFVDVGRVGLGNWHRMGTLQRDVFSLIDFKTKKVSRSGSR